MKTYNPQYLRVLLFLPFIIYSVSSIAGNAKDDSHRSILTITMTCPQDITINCPGQVLPPDISSVTATSTCGGATTINFVSDVTINQICPSRYTIQRTYDASDLCGAQASCVQMITVLDNISPAITCPSNIAVSCIGQVPPPNPSNVTSTENCAGNAVITYLSDVIIPGICPNQYNVVRTYRATDACGNSSNCIQTILVNDNTGPVLINCPPDLTVNSSGVPSPCSVVASITSPQALDLCDPNIQVINNFNSTNDASGLYPEGTTPVIWTATDNCGNTATCVFSVTVVCDPFPIIEDGQSVVTNSSQLDPNNPNGFVLSLVDGRNIATSGMLQNLSLPVYRHPDWTVSQMGEIFGIALDHQKNIYTTATKIYAGNENFNATGPGGHAGIYQIDALTGNVNTIVNTNSNPGANTIGTNQIPNSSTFPSGLGNLCYDEIHQQLFVTNFEDGRIYRVAAPGHPLNLSGGEVLSTFDPFIPDDGSAGPACLGERLFGIGLYNHQLYFSRWNENVWSPPGSIPNEIHSIAIDPLSGDFVGGALLEIIIPSYNSTLFGLITNPISDIEFNSQGDMLLAERGFYEDTSSTQCDFIPYPNIARVLEYSGSTGNWGPAKQFFIGNDGDHANAAGGIDYGYDQYDPQTNTVTGCENLVWATGDLLINQTNDYVFGLSALSASGNAPAIGTNYAPLASWYMDLDGETTMPDWNNIGDVDIVQGICVSSVCNPCDSVSISVTEYDTCCYSVDLNYTCNQPFFSKIQFDILTPNVLFGAQALASSWNFCGLPSLISICIEPSTGLVQPGQHNNLFSFCLTNVDFSTPSPQMIKVTYWTSDINGQDSIACDTIIDVYCFYSKKLCASVTHDNIHCIEDMMKYEITVTVQNISSPPFIAYNLSMIGPGLTPNPVPLIPPLPNDGTTRTVTYCYTPNPWPDPDGLLFLTYGLLGLNGDTSCYGGPGLYDTLVLTPCDTCLCLGFQNVNFYYFNGLASWQYGVFCDTTFVDTLPCIPPSGFYQFEGDYLCSDSCQATVDYEIYSLDLHATILSGTINPTNIGNNTHHFNLITGFQLISGHYQLILKGHCGSDYCRCVIDFFIRDCDPLCPDNLVINPRFESYSQCPTTISNIIEANSWFSPTLGTPDYFNACAAYNSFPDIPNNFAGSQVPHSGTGYAGFIFYRNNTIKEYIETPLSSPLVPGMTYEISFYVSLADESRLAIDNLGVYLSNGPVGPTLNSNPLNFIPQISSPPGLPITNKIGWTQVKGTITPLSGTNYDHLVIGNFVNTNTVVNTGTGYLNDAYYYVDDISVCKISDTCMCTGFQNMEMYYSNGLTGWQFGLSCNTGAIDTLPCIPQGELYHFKGEFSCSDSCLASANYDIISVASGLSVQNGPLTLVPIGTNSFQFDLVSGFNHPPGNYKLTTEGHCGMDSCQCVIEFFIPSCDTCACGSLVWAEVLNVGTTPRPVFCDSTALVIKCKKAGPNFFLHGDMTCHPDTCGNDTVFWKLERPGGLPDLFGFSLTVYPHFDIGIPWSDFSKPGNYTLTISRNCGGKVCTCKFNLVVQQCPCACPVQKDVNNGFTVVGNKNSCVRKFKPVKLCPNDMVSWKVNGPGINNQIVGSSLGTNNFQMTFPIPGGSYQVYMIVKRIDPLSGDSCFGQFCQKVIVKCKSGSPKYPTITACTGGDRLINGDFDEEFIPGHLGEEGRIPNWELFPNFGNGIVLIDSSGASDDGHVVLIGGQNNFAGIFQQVNLIGDSAYLGFYTINYLQEEAPIGTQLEFRLQSEPVPGSPGQTIYRHVLDTSLLSWVEVSVALPFDINPSYQFLVVCVQNENTELQSVVGVDNIELCTDETVGILQPYPSTSLRIYPNPNSGEFTIEFSEPAIFGSSIRIIDLAGQLVSERKIDTKNQLQEMKTTQLPEGMYFLQIVSKGHVLSVNKFVKM